MKLMLGNTPVKKMMIHNDTQDATMVASDLQAGVTCYAKGQKVIGTGKCFEFANYGKLKTNLNIYVPTSINIIEVASAEYPIKLSFELSNMKTVDFSTGVQIATVVIDGSEYSLTAIITNNMLKIVCDQTFYLQIFYGKDNYV